jgi:ABC-type Na+ efflux pump permease subunit
VYAVMLATTVVMSNKRDAPHVVRLWVVLSSFACCVLPFIFFSTLVLALSIVYSEIVTEKQQNNGVGPPGIEPGTP